MRDINLNFQNKNSNMKLNIAHQQHSRAIQELLKSLRPIFPNKIPSNNKSEAHQRRTLLKCTMSEITRRKFLEEDLEVGLSLELVLE